MPQLPSIENARLAKAEAKRRLANIPEVAGIGLTRSAGGYALKVNLSVDRPGLVPAEVAGVPVVVEVTGQIRRADD